MGAISYPGILKDQFPQCKPADPLTHKRFLTDEARDRSPRFIRKSIIENTDFERIGDILLDQVVVFHPQVIVPEFVSGVDLPEHQSHPAYIRFYRDRKRE